MNNIKKIIAVTMAVLMLFAFSACSQNEYTDTVVTVTDEDGNAVTDDNGNVVTEIVTEEKTSNETTSANDVDVSTTKSDSDSSKNSNETTKKSSNKTTTKKSSNKETTTKATTLASSYTLKVTATLPVETNENDSKKYNTTDVHVYIQNVKTGEYKELLNSKDDDKEKGETVELNGKEYVFTQKVSSGNDLRGVKVVIGEKIFTDYFKFNKDRTYKLGSISFGIESANGVED